MCYPNTATRAVSQQEVTRFSKSWSPVQLVRSINKKIYNNGLHISRKIVRVTGKAKNKVVTVQRWVFNLTFAKIIIPLAFFLFILLLHPHTEIQVGAVTTFSILFLLFLLITSVSSKCHSKDDLSPSIGHVSTNNVIPQSNLALIIYSCLPLASISRGWGWLASCEFPKPIRILIIWIFALASGCDRTESEHDLTEYKSLSDYFTRRLKPGVRPISDTSDLVSPADGTVTASSPLGHHGFTHIVKGLSYSLDLFLGNLQTVSAVIHDKDDIITDDSDDGFISSDEIKADLVLESVSKTDIHCVSQLLTNKSNKLYETTIYLSPGDYHRFHSPADWTVKMRRYFPGTMYSVSPKIVKMIPTCIVTNERVAWYGRWKYGTFIMVAVAATNVGDIKTDFDSEIITNSRDQVSESEKIYETPLNFCRGDDFGHFNFGSTLVLIYEAPHEINFGPNPVKRVKMGEGLYI